MFGIRFEVCVVCLHIWEAGVGADEDVVFFAFRYSLGHDERVAGVELSSVSDPCDKQ